MSIITPTPIATLPTPPVKGQAGFNLACEAYFNALVNPFTPQVNAAISATNENALSAQSSAIAAAAAAAAANAELWDAVTVYAIGVVVISPAALAAGAASVTYVCRASTGSTHIDPYYDPTHWAIFTVSSGVGGAAYNTSTTLTSSSPFAISISGGSGVWLKLPDATAMSKGLAFSVRNTGDNDLAVLDSTGITVGFIRPQCGTTIALSDSSTASGKWVGDFEQIGVTADFQFGAAVAGLQNVKQIIQLDAVRTMVITGGSNGQNLVAAIYDTTTQSAGAATIVRAAAYGSMAVKSAADQVLCVAWDNGNPGNLYATVLTIAGTSITVNTAATAAITGQFTGVGNWATVGGALCLSYNVSYNNVSLGMVRAITIIGTTPSIGAEQYGGASGAPRLYVSGSVLRAVRVSSSSYVACTPYSISGNTMTAGTQASTATTISDGAIRSFQYAGGDIGVLHANGGYWVESIFKITSTAESVLSTNIRGHGGLAANSITANMFDYSVVDSTKIQFACVLNSDYSTFSTNNIINNDGSPTAGTALDYSNTAGASSVLEVVCATGERGFIVSSERPISAAYSCSLMLFDASGSSPVRTKVFNLADKIPSNFAFPYGLPKSKMGLLNGQLCGNNRGIFNVISVVGVSTSSGKFTPNSASAYMLGASGAQIPYKTQPLFRAAGSVRGENNQTTWAVMPLTTVPEGSLGVAFQRVQIAQV